MKKGVVFKLGAALISAIVYSLIEILYYKREFTIGTIIWGAILCWPILLWGKFKEENNKDDNKK
ncbi:MAG: hypothetical protein R2831_06815 [Chitinophagaceae bacterium]